MKKRQVKIIDLIQAKEAAKYMGLSENALSTLVSMDRIPYIKMSRYILFTKKLLDNWMKEQVTMPMPSRKS